MSVELVTGYYGVGEDGKPKRHVSSAEDGARQAGTVGLGCYALSTGSKLSATMEDANTLVVAGGDVMMNGRHVSLPDTTSFTIPTGVQGQKVSNLAVLRYEKAADSVESVTPLVLTGEPSADTPTDPAYNEGSILDGDSPVDMPLYRVITDGINAEDPEPLFDVLASMAELRDLVSQAIDVKQDQTWNDIVVSARECAGVVAVTVERWNQSGTATIFKEPSVAGHIKAGHRPPRAYRQLLGVKGDGTWLYMEVDAAGAVKVGTLYAPGDSSTWGSFSGSVSYPISGTTT